MFGVHNNRELIIREGNKFHVDEDKLDLFSYYEKPIPDWIPKNKNSLKPYDQLSKIFADIETTGLDPDTHQIVLIGMMNERGDSMIISDLDDEALMLQKFIHVLKTKSPEILAFFNGFKFDIPFIIRRCEIHGIAHPFTIRDKTTVFRTAQKNGKPTEYNAIYVKGFECAIIDLYHQVLAWDFVARKLTGHSLKQSVLQMGLRKESRLELSYQEMVTIWKNRHSNPEGIERLKEYLVYDLEDTKLLGDRLIPSIYYQKMFLDWNLQSLSTGGNGSKWNSILVSAIPALDYEDPDTQKTIKGGYTSGIAGYYRNVVKIDVNSLYPSIMLTYGIHSRKDRQAIQLQILKYMTNERLRLKKLADVDPEADQMQGSMKVMINSSYGSLGCVGIPINDYEAAALVTAYGRAIVKYMSKIVTENDGFVIETDTDACIYSCKMGDERRIWEAVNKAMPKGISVAFEWHAKSFFVPPVEIGSREGLKKNYIIVFDDGKIKANGRYRKRDRCVLEKTFQQKLVELLTFKNKNVAYGYYERILEEIIIGEHPIEDLAIKRKARVNEKRINELGVVDDEGIAYYWMADDRVGRGGKRYYKATNSEPYSVDFYSKLVERLFREVIEYA